MTADDPSPHLFAPSANRLRFAERITFIHLICKAFNLRYQLFQVHCFHHTETQLVSTTANDYIANAGGADFLSGLRLNCPPASFAEARRKSLCMKPR